VVDFIKDGRIRIVFNTPLGGESFYDDAAIRKSAVVHNVLVVTTLTATAATVQAIRALRERATDILSLQEIHLGEQGGEAGVYPPEAARSGRVADGSAIATGGTDPA
jgi:hypothetical protein